MPPSIINDNETARYAVRSYLAARPMVAQTPETIQRMLATEHQLTLEHVSAALYFLTDLRQVKLTRSSLGAACYFQITAEGSLAEERGE